MLTYRKMSYVVLLYVLSLSTLCKGESFSTTFFDVGQGNCTLIDYRNDENPRDLILVDCGSSSYQGKDKKDDNYKEKVIKHIATTICQALVNANQVRVRGLKIIISHADSDHLNLIHLIIDECAKLLKLDKLDRAFVTEVFLGSQEEYMRQAEENEQESRAKKSDATPAKPKRKLKKKVGTPDGETPYHPRGAKTKARRKKKGPCQKKLLDYLVKKNIDIRWVTEKSDAIKPLCVDASDDNTYTCTILPALRYSSPQKANDSTLVVRISYNKKVVMLSGDATGATISHIIEHCDADFLKTTILQASHHGADKDGCNSEQWIKATSPTYVVFSAGIRLDYMHPLSTIFRRYLEHLPTPDAESFAFRPFYSGLEKEAGKPNLSMMPFERAHFQEGYGLGVCSKGLYSTLNQGTICFSIKDSKLSIACAHSTEAPNGPESLMQALSKNPNEGFFQLATLTLLNLSSFGLDDTMPRIKGLLEILLESLTAQATGLETFYINHNSLCESTTFRQLLSLYRMMFNKYAIHQEEELGKQNGVIRPFAFDISHNLFSKELLTKFPALSICK